MATYDSRSGRNKGPRGPYHAFGTRWGAEPKPPATGGERLRQARIKQGHTQAAAAAAIEALCPPSRYGRGETFGRARITRLEGGGLPWPAYGTALEALEAYCLAGGFPKPAPPKNPTPKQRTRHQAR